MFLIQICKKSGRVWGFGRVKILAMSPPKITPKTPQNHPKIHHEISTRSHTWSPEVHKQPAASVWMESWTPKQTTNIFMFSFQARNEIWKPPKTTLRSAFILYYVPHNLAWTCPKQAAASSGATQMLSEVQTSKISKEKCRNTTWEQNCAWFWQNWHNSHNPQNGARKRCALCQTTLQPPAVAHRSSNKQNKWNPEKKWVPGSTFLAKGGKSGWKSGSFWGLHPH